MTGQSLLPEVERLPYRPLRLRWAGGRVVDLLESRTVWVGRHAVVVVHPVAAGTQVISGYGVIALDQIESVEHLAGV